MDPLPKNNKRFFASEEGEISEFENNDSQKSPFKSGYIDSLKSGYCRSRIVSGFTLPDSTISCFILGETGKIKIPV